jgi:glucans biosynthesis protein
MVATLLVVTLHANQTHHFTFAKLQALAEQRATVPYVPPPDLLPPQLKSLSSEQEATIFWKDTNRLWRKKGLPFQVDFYHVGRDVPGGPIINVVDRKRVTPLRYSPDFFNFPNLTFNPPLPSTLPYGGFYLRYPINKPDSLDGFFSVESTGTMGGGNYFRVLAKDQVYGLSARGLALNTGVDGKKEEFPDFREWWLNEPAADATELVLYALLDSPSVSGAYEFKVRPGAVTSVDVSATLFFRKKVDRLGLTPFSSMYLYGENAKDHFGDNVHPEIHDSDGVLMETGTGEWDWRPLQQRPDLQIYNLFDVNPKGYGLIQRDRDFQHYQDLALNYNVRPSAWVTPHGDWGKGAVQLIQLPSNNTNTDNVVLFWHPDREVNAGDRMDLSYTIDFYMNDAERPPLGYAKQTLVAAPAPPPLAEGLSPAPAGPSPAPPAKAGASPVVKAAALKPSAPPLPPVPPGVLTAQFVVDFAGNGLESLSADQPLQADVTCLPAGAVLREKPKVEKNGFDNSWRVTFTVIPVKAHVPTEIRCRLLLKGKVLTETWNYTWNQ